MNFLRGLWPFLILAAVVTAVLAYADAEEDTMLGASGWCEHEYGDETREEVSWDLKAYCLLDDGNVRIRIDPHIVRRLREIYGD